MLVVKIILGILAIWFGFLTFLRTIQHFNLFLGTDYTIPFPYLNLAITIALIILIIIL